MISIGTEVNKPIEISYREMKSACAFLEKELKKWSNNPAQRLSLDIDALKAEVPDVIYFSTAQYWGVWKCITQKEIVWTLNRSQALRLYAALQYRLQKRHKGLLSVSEGWFRNAPLFY